MTGKFLPDPPTCTDKTVTEVFTWTIPALGASYITNNVNDIIEIQASTLDAASTYELTVSVAITVSDNPGIVTSFSPAAVTFTV